VIVTHEFFKGVRGDRARHYAANGLRLPRAVTFVDERAVEVDTFDLRQSDFISAWEFAVANDDSPEPLRDGLDALQRFAASTLSGDRDLENPRHDAQAWDALTGDLAWFRTEDASRYLAQRLSEQRSIRRKLPSNIEDVFAFAECAAERRAFIVRSQKGKAGTHFMAYRTALPPITGMVLLDASADIDGVSELCRWRNHAPVPLSKYDRMKIVHVPSPAAGTVTTWLNTKTNRIEYARHILDTV